MKDGISAQELSEVLQKAPKAYLVDVREEEEVREVHLTPTVVIPLGEFEDRYKELPKDQPVYLYCRSGRRSRIALEFLKTKGYDNGFNLEGGILAWQNEIDPEGRTV